MFKKFEKILNEAFGKKYSLTEADRVEVGLPTFANKESDVNLKSLVKSKQDKVEAERKAEEERKHREELRQKYAGLIDKAQSALDESQNIDDAVQVLFEELVPPSGPCDTVAGELIRSISRIRYRDWNDGDVFYEGYGIETCGPAVSYIIDNIDGMFDKFDNIAKAQYEDDKYTDAINGIAKDIVEYIINNPETLETPRIREMFDYNCDWIYRDWEPKYEFDISFERPELEEHIEAGHISEDDVRDWVESCIEYEPGCKGAEIEHWDWDSYNVTNLTREGYDYLSRNFYRWLDDWVSELDEEYPFEDEEDDEDEFDESCHKKSNKKPIKESDDKTSLYQSKVDNAIKKFGRVGGKLYDELDDNGFYLDKNNKVVCKSLKESFNINTVADFFKFNGYADVDAYDEDWDYGTAIVWENEKPRDGYDRFVDWFVKNTNFVQKVDDITIIVGYGDLVNRYHDAIEKFCNENNRDGYTFAEYDDEQDQEEVGILTLISMLEGNYSDSDYDEFLALVR